VGSLSDPVQYHVQLAQSPAVPVIEEDARLLLWPESRYDGGLNGVALLFGPLSPEGFVQ